MKKEITGEQILQGIKKAIHKMLVEEAKKDGSIVISDENGNPVKIKAKKALKNWNK